MVNSKKATSIIIVILLISLGLTGNLTDDEITYLKTTKNLFEQVDELLKGHQIENTADALALQMIEDHAWIGIVEQINDLFADTPDLDYLFAYRSTHD